MQVLWRFSDAGHRAPRTVLRMAGIRKPSQKQSSAISLDDLVGGGKQGRRDREAERLRSLQVYDELEFG